jgi:hypothetical protein
MSGAPDPIDTKVGWAGFGDYHHFGKRLYAEVVGHTSFLGLGALAVTGKLPPKEDVALLDDIAACFQCPEPRVWPTKLVRIASSNGGFVPGMIAGWSALVSGIGTPIAEAAANMLLDLQSLIASASDADLALRDYVATKPGLPGFWVYGRRVDERVAPIRAAVARHGRADRPMWSLGERLWAAMEREHGLTVSVWGAFAASLLDLGFAPRDMQSLLSLFFQPSCVAHAVEGARLRSESLRELPAANVRYVGAPPRTSPRSAR